MKKKYIMIGLIVANFLFVFAEPKYAYVVGEDGVFSYPTDVHKQELIPLVGQWEFYWNELLMPEDFNENVLKEKRQVTDVPHGKYGFEFEGKQLSSTGYGTYRLIVHFPNEKVGKEMALYIPSIASAYIVWVDGEKRAESGKVGHSRETMVPMTVPNVVPFTISANEVDIVIQTSNFHQRKGGIYNPILLGEVETVLKHKTEKLMFRSAIFISLLVIGLYHIALYFFRRKEKGLAYFGIVCLFVAIRGSILEEEIRAFLYSFLSFELLTKIEYLGALLGVIFLTMFSHELFKKDMNVIAKRIVCALNIIFGLFVIVTPAIIFTQFLQLFLFVVFIGFIHLIVVYLLAVFRKREGAILNGTPMLVLFICVMNDLLYYSGHVETIELTTVGTIFFLFSQTVTIAKQYSTALSKSENMSKQLERLVKARTKQLEEANRKLLIANKKLEQAHEERTNLINEISHEIATPLTNIQAYTSGMLDEIVPMDKRHIQLIHEKGILLSKLLEDFKSLVHLETKKMRFNFIVIDARNYFQQIYERNKYDIDKQGIAFNFEDSGNRGEKIYIQIDEFRMEQVIGNLLSNAMKFTKKGGEITLKISRDQNILIVTVADNGIGMKKEELPLIFNRYYSNSRGVTERGTGLGLVISKEIVKTHGGRMEVESEEGKGSTFSIYLPIKEIIESGN